MAINFPNAPIAGDTYQDPTSLLRFRFDGTAWIAIPVEPTTLSDIPPSNPAPGDTWYETDTGIYYLYYDDGTSQQWVSIVPGQFDPGGDGSPFTDDGTYVTYTGPNNVGIGTGTPASKLDVTGNVNVTGNIDVSGTVDGRDVAADGTKLDGIGAGANVAKVGTPANDQIGVWTGDGTIEGDANLTWDGNKIQITGTIPELRLRDTDTTGQHSVFSNGVFLQVAADNGNLDAGSGIQFTVDNTEHMRLTSNGNLKLGSGNGAVTLDIDGTDAVQLTVGTTAQRPVGAAGMLRYNTTLSQFDVYTDQWRSLVAQGTAKTWVVYDQLTDIAIDDDINVTSVTDNSAGNFTINFTTNMATATGLVTGTYYINNGITGSSNDGQVFAYAKATTDYDMLSVTGAASPVDGDTSDVAIYGEYA